MRELVETIAKALVENPDEVVVTEKASGRSILIELQVAPSDMGKVIGKQGRIAKALRSVVKAAASRDDKKVIIDIVEGLWLADAGWTARRAFVKIRDLELEKHGTVSEDRNNHFHTCPQRRGKGLPDHRGRKAVR